MTIDYTNRNKVFTDKEFNQIPRNNDGDISHYDIDFIFCWLTEKQINKLSGDDYTRYCDHKEELEYLVSEFI